MAFFKIQFHSNPFLIVIQSVIVKYKTKSFEKKELFKGCSFLFIPSYHKKGKFVVKNL